MVTGKFILILTFLFLPFLSFSWGKKHNRKGVYVRIVNTDSIATSGYEIDEKYYFDGLKPNDTSEYKYFKKFNSDCRFVVHVGNRAHGTRLTDCRTCVVDSPKFITVEIYLDDKNDRVPRVRTSWYGSDER